MCELLRMLLSCACCEWGVCARSKLGWGLYECVFAWMMRLSFSPISTGGVWLLIGSLLCSICKLRETYGYVNTEPRMIAVAATRLRIV